MLETYSAIFEHMGRFHPDSPHWGDSYVTNSSGEVIFQKCQLCGLQLVKSPGVYKSLDKQEQELRDSITDPDIKQKFEETVQKSRKEICNDR